MNLFPLSRLGVPRYLTIFVELFDVESPFSSLRTSGGGPHCTPTLSPNHPGVLYTSTTPSHYSDTSGPRIFTLDSLIYGRPLPSPVSTLGPEDLGTPPFTTP